MFKKTQRCKKNKSRFKIICLIIIIFCMVIYILCYANATIAAATENGIRQNFSKAVKAAVEDVLPGVEYDDLVTLRTYNSDAVVKNHKIYSSDNAESYCVAENSEEVFGKALQNAAGVNHAVCDVKMLAYSQSLNERRYQSLNGFSVYEYNKSGFVLYLNCAALSVIGYRVARLAETYYGAASKGGAQYYLSSAIGIPSLAFSFGKVRVGLPDSCYIDCGFGNEFNAVGINRSVHSVFLEIMCKVVSAGIFSSENITEIYKVPLVACMFEGEVPEVILRY